MIWRKKDWEKQKENKTKLYLIRCDSWECSCRAICDRKPTPEELKKTGFCEDAEIKISAVKLEDILNKLL